jgi:hypothetical protein
MQSSILVIAVLLALLLTLSASARVKGVPPSVTSFGFGRQAAFHGIPPGVTSLGARGFAPSRGIPHQPRFNPQSGMHRHHHRHEGDLFPYYVPYDPTDSYDDSVPDEAVADPQDDPDQDQGGPTGFDPQGSGARTPNDYNRIAAAPPRLPASAAPSLPGAEIPVTRNAPESPREVPVQPATILVFKDGHTQEVSNYAIMGTNLFDLTPGHRLKVALSDLDVAATQKANEDQGIDFQLPELPNGT